MLPWRGRRTYSRGWFGVPPASHRSTETTIGLAAAVAGVGLVVVTATKLQLLGIVLLGVCVYLAASLYIALPRPMFRFERRELMGQRLAALRLEGLDVWQHVLDSDPQDWEAGFCRDLDQELVEWDERVREFLEECAPRHAHVYRSGRYERTNREAALDFMSSRVSEMDLVAERW